MVHQAIYYLWHSRNNWEWMITWCISIANLAYACIMFINIIELCSYLFFRKWQSWSISRETNFSQYLLEQSCIYFHGLRHLCSNHGLYRTVLILFNHSSFWIPMRPIGQYVMLWKLCVMLVLGSDYLSLCSVLVFFVNYFTRNRIVYFSNLNLTQHWGQMKYSIKT